MNCNFCGKELKEGAKFCTECGRKVEEAKTGDTKGSITVEKTTTITNTDVPVSNSKAVASLVLGILSLFLGVIFLPIPIVGLILGIAQKGKSGLKTAGIILNAIFLVLSIITWIFVAIFIVAIIQSENGSGYYESREENNGNSDIIIQDGNYNDDVYDYNFDFFDFD